MSIRLMSQVWDTKISTSQKLVLLSLADQANDDGVCWPSIETMSRRTGLCERAIRQAISALEKNGHITRQQRAGRSTNYIVHPGTKCPTALNAHLPRHEMPPTPASGAPTPASGAPTPASGAPITINKQQRNQNKKPKRTIAATSETLPAVITEQAQTENPAPAGADAVQVRCRAIWHAYSAAFFARYGTEPVRNAKINAQVRQLDQRLGQDAEHVAGYYLAVGDGYVVKRCHDFGTLLAQAEAYRTQWVTGRQITSGVARQLDQTATNMVSADEAKRIIRARASA